MIHSYVCDGFMDGSMDLLANRRTDKLTGSIRMSMCDRKIGTVVAFLPTEKRRFGEDEIFFEKTPTWWKESSFLVRSSPTFVFIVTRLFTKISPNRLKDR